MRPRIDVGGLAKPAAWEYVVRFVFGGIVTVATGLVGKRFGPVYGGMLLAFPAILPATLTLVKRHDGRDQACDDARGARIGACGLLAFALVVAATAERWPAPLVLASATGAWLAVAVALWFAAYGRRRRR
jgi:hypothetical protein